MIELECITSESTITWFCRGHVDKSKMLEAMKDEDVCDLDKFTKPEHLYFRVRPDNSGEFECWYYPVEGPGKGAFPVTEVHRDW